MTLGKTTNMQLPHGCVSERLLLWSTAAQYVGCSFNSDPSPNFMYGVFSVIVLALPSEEQASPQAMTFPFRKYTSS